MNNTSRYIIFFYRKTIVIFVFIISSNIYLSLFKKAFTNISYKIFVVIVTYV